MCWPLPCGARLAALVAAGVDSVLTKGTALAYSADTRPEYRRRADTNLLVMEIDLEQARAMLAGAGFARLVALPSLCPAARTPANKAQVRFLRQADRACYRCGGAGQPFTQGQHESLC